MSLSTVGKEKGMMIQFGPDGFRSWNSLTILDEFMIITVYDYFISRNEGVDGKDHWQATHINYAVRSVKDCKHVLS